MTIMVTNSDSLKLVLILVLVLGSTVGLLSESFGDEERKSIYKLANSFDNGSDVVFNLPYAITNGTVQNINNDSHNIIIEITSQDDGLLEIEIPKSLHHVQNNRDPAGNQFILVDGVETKFEQTATLCTLKYFIPFANGSESIEIASGYTMGYDPILPYVPPKECLTVLCGVEESPDLASSGRNILAGSVNITGSSELLEEFHPDQNFILSHNDIQYNIEYHITNGNNITNIYKNPDVELLIIQIDANSDGILSLSIPYKLVGFGFVEGCYENEWFVVLDDKELHPFEQLNKQSTRIILIPFNQDVSEIEIVAEFVPETPMYLADCIQQTQHNMTPRQQTANGISADNVICKNNLDLVFKSTIGNPACVNPDSIPKLVERGWAKP